MPPFSQQHKISKGNRVNHPNELLGWYYTQKYSGQMKKEIKSLSPKVIGVLKTFKWPGDVRELQNVILRTVINVSGE